jgi:hypothetical protein
LTTLHIHELSIDVDPNTDNVTLNVKWTKGYMDNATYVVAEKCFATLSGQDVVSAMEAVPSGKSIYDAVKEAAWGILQGRQLVPAGVIS